MKLQYKWHSYSTISDHEVEVPDDIVFIHNQYDIGDGLDVGFGHYLGCSIQDNTYVEDFGLHIYTEFSGLTMFAFNNVAFESEVKTVSPEEFFDKFDIGDYYIFTYTEDKLVPNDDSNCKHPLFKPVPGRLVSVSKILKMESQNLIDLMVCQVSSWLESDDSTAYGIMVDTHRQLSRLFRRFKAKTVIRKGCDKEFTEAINRVLGVINKEAINKV